MVVAFRLLTDCTTTRTAIADMSAQCCAMPFCAVELQDASL